MWKTFTQKHSRILQIHKHTSKPFKMTSKYCLRTRKPPEVEAIENKSSKIRDSNNAQKDHKSTSPSLSWTKNRSCIVTFGKYVFGVTCQFR